MSRNTGNEQLVLRYKIEMLWKENERGVVLYLQVRGTQVVGAPARPSVHEVKTLQYNAIALQPLKSTEDINMCLRVASTFTNSGVITRTLVST